MQTSTPSPESLDRIFFALSNGTRRAMLERLRSGDASIGELAAPFEMSLPGASKHVRVLESAGLVRRHVDGRVHRCALQAAPLEDAESWLHRYRRFWASALDGLADFVEDEP